MVVAERIRKAIEDRLHLGHLGLNQITAYDLSKSLIDNADEANMNDAFFLARDITCSFGVANYLQSGQSDETLFSNADDNLYTAKEEGRNKVTIINKCHTVVVVLSQQKQ